jgi:hypothetical protein
MEGFVIHVYAAEMCSGAMMYTPTFINIDSGIQKLMRDTQTAWSSHKPTIIFQNTKIRLKMAVSGK